MDTIALGISATKLIPLLGSKRAPLLLDVRRAAAFDADSVVIASATWRDPFAVDDWLKFLPHHREIVVYCVHGHEISKNTCSALRTSGSGRLISHFLEGGIEAWKAAGGPTIKKGAAPGIPSAVNKPSKWITRERPKIDRIACPWLIRRFIDPMAEFIYVPAEQVLAGAHQQAAIPYDVPGVQFTHRGDQCSFDALIEDFQISDPTLDALALIVRGADTGKPELAAQSAGLLAISLGLSALYADDHQMLDEGMNVYDALYAWIKTARAEVHNADFFKQP